jgi:uncharacterized protein
VTVFVDTSALYALLDKDDDEHEAAEAAFRALRGQDLVTHAYVVVETAALAARRLGPEGTAPLFDGILSVVETEAVDGALHREAVAAYRTAGSRSVSLVDRTSFEFMRRHAIGSAFTFDADFRTAGFDLIPTPGDRVAAVAAAEESKEESGSD